jgi:hypothetical protein
MSICNNSKLSLYIAVFCLVLIPYNNLTPIPGIGQSLSPQRVLLLLFVFSSFFLTEGRFKKDIIYLYNLQMAFLISILLQLLFIINTTELHQLLTFLQIIIFMLFVDQLYYLLSDRYILVYKTLLFSANLLVIYQLFQLSMYTFGYPNLVSILNDPIIMEESNFYRIIGYLLGPAGFMAESSHVAIFIGPLVMVLIISNNYGHFKSSSFQRGILLLGLFLTLSGSSIIQFVFILFTYLLIVISKKQARHKAISSVIIKIIFNIVIIIIISVILYKYYEVYVDAMLFKTTDFIKLESVRMQGARIMLENLSKNMLWGTGFGKFIEPGVDHNFFLTTLLVEQGVVGGITFLMLFFFPILIRFIKSPFKLYFIPFISMVVNVFFAIGTYRWPLIWIIYTLTLYNLSPLIHSPSSPARETGEA